jgi:hypothetical protein
VGDTSNWEFAAVVAAVSIGLSGLLLFTLVTIISSWRTLAGAARAAKDASEASVLVQDLARQLAAREAATMTAAGLAEETRRLAEARKEAEALVVQQGQLQEAVRHLVEAGVLRQENGGTDLSELKASIDRLDDHLGQLAAAIAQMARRDT